MNIACLIFSCRLTCVLLCLLIQADIILVSSRRNHRVHENSLPAPVSRGIKTSKQIQDNLPASCTVKLPNKCNCSQSESHLSITCSNSGLTSVPELDIGSNLVTTLNLEQNKIQSVQIGSFYGLQIERLILSNNSISSLGFLAFWGLEYKLETLDLSYNFFGKVPSSSLRLLRNLRSLSLKANKIKALEDYDFGYLKSLEILSLDNNPIASISPHTFEGSQLSLLVLNYITLRDGLKSFAVGDLKHLNGLSLADNGLSEIPDGWFNNFTSLRYLGLDGNKCTSLQDNAFAGVDHTLQTLEMNNNDLETIPKATLRNLPNLKTLTLSHNRLQKIYPNSFNCSTKLQTLDLSYNSIDKISMWAFEGMDTMQKIDLSHNYLATLDSRTLYWADPRGREILLAGNPWLCNCLLKWIKRELKQQTDLSTMFTDGLDMLCSRPFHKGSPEGIYM